jgi:nicotinamidase-related amidase
VAALFHALGLRDAAAPAGGRARSRFTARFIPPAAVIDKPGYSAFFASPLQSFLAKKEISSLIVSGSETDVCVLATVLDAVDHGYRAVVVEDGLCSSSDQGHDALMTLYRTRLTDQTELIGLEEVIGLWREAP